jgi:hypothetical protein
MSFKITAVSDLWESRGTFTLDACVLSNDDICKNFNVLYSKYSPEN